MEHTMKVLITVVFLAPLMTTIAELGSFLTREQAAAGQPAPLAAVSPPPSAAAANGAAVSGAAEPS
jgi:hypothetical protein